MKPLPMRVNGPGLDRRRFVQAGCGVLGSLLLGRTGAAEEFPPVRIKDIQLGKGAKIEAENGVAGSFGGSPVQDIQALQAHLPAIRSLLIGKNAFDSALGGEAIWEALFPGKARLFGEGVDPLTGEVTRNRPRAGRHTPTSRVFAAISTIDVALWDLRGRLLQKPAYQILGPGRRPRVPVYWRPGEVGIAPALAARKAREAFDRGYLAQKWYFNKGAADGEAGFKDNVELVRALREELPDAQLMFDNHSIRYSDDVDYSVRLCKAVAPYRPFWIEEPICPEHIEGYCRIKAETGLTIAGGEHWYTRWQVKPFLDRKCVDFVQSDPLWCGGISEWLKICELARGYPGLKVVPHITSPWVVAPHCVASQPEDLCPLLEYNSESGKQSLDSLMELGPGGSVVMALPREPGIS